MSLPGAPPPYDGAAGCSQDCQPPAYPSPPSRAPEEPVLLSVTHLADPQDVNIDYNCQGSQTRDTTNFKPIVSIQPNAMPRDCDDEYEPETCCDHLKFWGCFTCLVFCWCLGNCHA